MTRLKEALKCLLLGLVCGLVGVLIYQAATYPQLLGVAVASRVDTSLVDMGKRLDAVGTRLDARDKQVAALLKNVNDFVDETYYDNYSNVQTTTVILRGIAELVRQTSEDILPEFKGLLQYAKALLVDMQGLAKAGTEDAKELNRVLANAADFLKTLDGELEEADLPGLAKRGDAILTDLHKVLGDENVPKTVANIERITHHGAESAKSVDMALQPLRSRAKLFAIILGKLVSMIRINISPF